MRVFIGWVFILLLSAGPSAAQEHCITYDYNRERQLKDPGLEPAIEAAERFVQVEIDKHRTMAGKAPASIITIPVVIHILYNSAAENIPDQQVYNQLRVLNECFRRLNADTSKTPARFRSRASDAGIEFKLAVSDPRRTNTTGIIRKYTPVTKWGVNDLMKYSSQAGDDAWDSQKYLNIWVCNIGRIAGYSTFPGDAAAVDGVVLNTTTFGIYPGTYYDGGKTAIHEVGHWLGLRHIWGDAPCGDDLVADTPPQSNFTMTCPASGIQLSCNNGPDGDMFMNYMDLSADACTNMFTEGQALRMRSYFAAGGARSKLPGSTGLQLPLISQIPLAEQPPTWLYANLYPNPARTDVNIDFSYDVRWVGKTLLITNAQGQLVSQTTISSKNVKIDVSNLKPGYYIISGKRDDGAKLQLKFVKI